VHSLSSRIFAMAILSLWAAAGHAQAVSNISDGVVFISINGPAGEYKNAGSGFVLGPNGFIATANHILFPIINSNNNNTYDGHNDKITLHFRSKDSLSVAEARPYSCVANDPKDYCILYVNSAIVQSLNIKKYFKLNCGMPAAGVPIIVAGFPPGTIDPLMVLPGNVTSNGLGDGWKMYMKAGIVPGISGGPVFAGGYVIGVVYGSVTFPGGGEIEAFTPLFENAGRIADTGESCSNVADTSLVVTSVPGHSVVDNTIETIGKTVPATDIKIFIQVADKSQLGAARQLADVLGKATFKVEDDFEVVGLARAPNEAVIKYFVDSDLVSVSAIQAASEKLQSLPKFTIEKVPMPNPPHGVVEVWFPKTR
jgi:hypothetical protein